MILNCTLISPNIISISSDAGDPISANHRESTTYEKTIDLPTNALYRRIPTGSKPFGILLFSEWYP
jgi:hypothetical protein